MQNLARPIIVEIHVAAAGKEKRRRGEARKRDKADKKGEGKNIVAEARRPSQSAPKIESPGRDGKPGHVNSGTARFFRV